jgi:hypothetical protein
MQTPKIAINEPYFIKKKALERFSFYEYDMKWKRMIKKLFIKLASLDIAAHLKWRKIHFMNNFLLFAI